MCGIAGILADPGAAPPRAAEAEAMVRALHHRGPDENGTFTEGPVALGHARLSIVDLAGGKQPMHNEDRSIWVVFNGEIYNHVELREELTRQGHVFATRSDTEVIVHAYEQHGVDGFLNAFNGQFAIALWDGPRQRLVLARDRAGVRPIFFAQQPGRFVFASEVKALRAVGAAGEGLDAAGLGQVFSLWGALSPRTPFAGVSSLPPGHLMVIENGQSEIRRYWDWSFAAEDDLDHRPIATVADELRTLLIDAVALRQLRSDVPVGAYLSGGLDSSIITAVTRRFTDTPLRTFSVTFDEAEFDESGYQKALVDHLGTEHTSVRCSRRDLGRAFPKTVWHMESPVLRTAPTPMMLLSELVRASGYKVVLTGEGADEVFCGYDIFKETVVRQFWSRRPESKMRPALLQRMYPYLATSPTASRAYAESFFKQGIDAPDDPVFGHRPRWNTTRRTWEMFSPAWRERLAACDPAEDVKAILPRALGAWPPLCRAQYVEARTLLPEYLLSSQGDRVGMANSIEGRFPFLDHRVIEFANRLLPGYKMFGLKEKYVLKRALGDLLPPVVAARPKQPYRAPDSASFFFDGKPLPYVAQLLGEERLRRAGYFDPAAVAKLVAKAQAGRAVGAVDNMAFVGVLSTMLLDEFYVRGTAWQDVAAEAGPA